METFQEDALKEHPGRDGPVTLINSTLSINACILLTRVE